MKIVDLPMIFKCLEGCWQLTKFLSFCHFYALMHQKYVLSMGYLIGLNGFAVLLNVL